MAEKWLASQAAANSRYAARASHDSAVYTEGDESNRAAQAAAMRRSANGRRQALPVVPTSSEPVSPERSSAAFRSGNERLYEAYNDLH